MMRRFLVIALPFVTVLGLALAGQYRTAPTAFIADPVEEIYRALQLFTIETNYPRDVPLPLELQIARFLAPLVTGAGLILVFVQGAWVALGNVRVRFRRDHVVVVGLNVLGWHFARSCRRCGVLAVAIERDDRNVHIEACRRLGIPVIVGDALAPHVLERAGVTRASHLITFVRDDGTNVELTLRAKSVGRETQGSRQAPLRVRCHLTDVHLAARLEEYPKFFLEPHLAEVSFFNAHGLAARTLLRQHPPEVYADALRRREVHVAVLGATPLGVQVVLQLARTAHFANFERPRITLCAEGVVQHKTRMDLHYPGLADAAQLSYVELALQPDGFDLGNTPFPVADVTAYVVCLEDDSAALSLALALRRATLLGRGLNAPVMVAMEKSDGLARLLESELGTPEIPDGLYPFGMLDEIVSVATIIDERLDRLAQAFHEKYLEEVPATDASSHKRSLVAWANLPEVYRSANRLAADHLHAKLRAVGCAEGAKGAVEDAFEFAADELERLAQMEHNRWLAVRRSTGWRAGETRSDFARIDTNLEPWIALDAAGRAYDLRNAREIPTILEKRLGRAVRREIVIGVTGHRLHRLNGRGDTFALAVNKTLDHVSRLYPGAAIIVLSSLAEGADRLIARAALERLGARLHVPLPLPYELYVEDFGSSSAMGRDASLVEFHDLLGRADRYFEMPLEFGTQVELAASHPASASARACQYALAGAYVAQRCHELIAVWDGDTHQGEGGTAQIIEWRLHGIPEAYRFPNVFFPTVEPKPPFVIPPDAGADFQPSRLHR